MIDEALQNTARRVLIWVFLPDKVTPGTGLTIPIKISKNCGALVNPNIGALNATEISNGHYYFDLAVADFDTLGPLWIHADGATFDDVNRYYNVKTQYSANIAALPNVAADGVNGLAINGMKAASYVAPGNADIATIKSDIESATYGLSAIKTVVDAINTDVGGSGSQQQVFSVTVGGNPVDGAHVWITTDVEGSSIVASGHTDALGVVTFLLDVGDYYWWKQHAGYNFTNPEAFSVSAP